MLIFEDYEKHIIEELKNRNCGFDELFKLGRSENQTIYNFVPMGFDIETYTQYETKDVKKKNRVVKKVTNHYTNMYIWQFGFGSKSFAGRTWEEFDELLELIKKYVCKGNYKTFLFIHNCGFEFSFLGRELVTRGHKIKVFARKKRHPLRVEIDEKIVILDSGIITGYSLKKLAENITKQTQKAVNDLDYTVPRNKFTKLDDIELGYCEADIRILVEYAEYYKENYLDIECPYMPLTSTMIANQVLKDKIKQLKVQKAVNFLMLELFPKSREQYEYIMQFFSGAYTHGMLCNLFQVLENLLSFDVCSEYPYITMSQKIFPMSKFRKMKTKELQEEYLKKYACLCKVTYTNVSNKFGVTIQSKHKSYDWNKNECIWDNGRLYSCSGSISFFMTEIDIEIFEKFYSFEERDISEMLVAKRGYLPNWYRLAIAELYSKKCLLKNVKGKEIEYMNSKANLNSLSYGAMATKLSFDEIGFDENWKSEPNDIDFQTMWYKKNKSPAWAIYITSGSRQLVLNAVYEIVKKDKFAYAYTDTDSIKCKNEKWIVEIFDNINKRIRKDNEKWVKELQLDKLYPNVDFCEMGTFENECQEKDGTIIPIEKFKSLGSKRYLTQRKGKLKVTVAGLPKGTFEKTIESKKIKEPFEFFSDKLFFDEVESEKLTAYYEDKEKEFEVVDKDGNVEICHTQSYVSLIPTTFALDVDDKLQMLFCNQELLNNIYLERKI